MKLKELIEELKYLLPGFLVKKEGRDKVYVEGKILTREEAEVWVETIPWDPNFHMPPTRKIKPRKK